MAGVFKRSRAVPAAMRQLRVTMTPSDPSIHPFCALTSGDGPVREAKSLYCNGAGENRLTSLFALRGDPAAIRSEFDRLEDLESYDMTAGVDDWSYANLQFEMNDFVRTLFEITSLDYLTLVLPVVYVDGHASLELVGPKASLQRAVDALPSDVQVDIEWIGTVSDGESPDTILSTRQREAIQAGLELGYYERPRQATHEDIAERIDCAPSTASEHLNRAEAKLVKSILNPS